MLDELLQHKVIVHSWAKTGTDSRGNDVATFTPAIGAGTASVAAFVQFNTERERKDGEETVVGTYTAYFLPAQVIKEQDRITYGGKVYEVLSVGEVAAPEGVHHKQVELRQVAGG